MGLHIEEFHNLYCPQNFIRVIKSRRVSWAGPQARMRERRNAYVVLVGRTEGKSHMADVDVDGRIILKCILKK